MILFAAVALLEGVRSPSPPAAVLTTKSGPSIASSQAALHYCRWRETAEIREALPPALHRMMLKLGVEMSPGGQGLEGEEEGADWGKEQKGVFAPILCPLPSPIASRVVTDPAGWG